mmetsp:Transcript_41934/g.58622  ORF Transcript_41934/g.58622 Transcript_41934/m.58622 type:complete len:318 (+) Transcript_41934:174-1127(+)
MLKMRKRVQKYEDELVESKPWQMMGQASKFDRPDESLLEESVTFEHATRTKPTITEEHTESLEDIIRRRIRDEAFDDVTPKTVEDMRTRKKVTKEEISTEKSNKSLADLYEEDYVNKQQQQNKQAEEEEKEELSEDQKEIQVLFRRVMHNLDKMSNFHFTPSLPEISVSVHTPAEKALTVEEVTPAAVSTEDLLVPEEVYAKPRKLPKSSAEKTKEERATERQEKKRIKRREKREKEANMRLVEKMNPGMGNPYSKQKALKELEQAMKRTGSGVERAKETDTTKYGRSKESFAKIQNAPSSKKKKDSSSLSGKTLKL